VSDSSVRASCAGSASFGHDHVTALGGIEWGSRRLVGSPALLGLAAVVGAGVALGVHGPFGLLSVALVFGTLGFQAVLFRHAGLASDDVDGYRDLLLGSLRAVPSLLGLVALLGLGVLGILSVAILGGALGLILALPVVALWWASLALAFPAACLDGGALSGLIVGWEYGKRARFSLLALFLFLGAPLAAVQHSIVGGDGPGTLVALGILWGCLLAITNLALARIYLGIRRATVEGGCQRPRSNRRPSPSGGPLPIGCHAKPPSTDSSRSNSRP